MFCQSNVHVLPVKRARLERKTTRKKVCAERLLANGNIRRSKLHLTLERFDKDMAGEIPVDYKESFGPISAFYAHCSVVYFSVFFSFQHFIPISFYPHFSVLASF